MLHRLTPGSTGHHQLHGRCEHVRDMDYLRLGRRAGPRLQRPLPDRRTTRDAHVELSLARRPHPRHRRRRPWLLMEHSTSAVNWQPRNVAKAPGQLRAQQPGPRRPRRGRACCFFQWRASRAGAEKFHSALLPHAGTDTEVWREVGRARRRPRRDRRGPPAAGCDADVAIVVRLGRLVGAPSWTPTPASTSTYLDRHRALYRRPVGRRGHRRHRAPDGRPDRLPAGPGADALPGHATPTPPTSARLRRRRRHRRWSPTSAASSTRTTTSGSAATPGAFRDLLGVRTEEFFPLREGETVRLAGRRPRWCRGRRVDRAAAPARRRGGRDLRRRPAARRPALTRHGSARAPPGTSPPGWTPTGTAALVRHLCARRRRRPVPTTGRASRWSGGTATRRRTCS